MLESIRKFKNNDELIKELESKKLVFPDNNSKQIFKTYLSQYGYYAFIKKMSNDLMFENLDPKEYKKEFTSNNLRYLFDIDRNISVIIFKFFRNIEFLLNSSLLKVISKKLNKIAKCPYLFALSSNEFFEIFKEINNEIKFDKRETKNSLAFFYNDIFKNFWNDDFNSNEAALFNKENENDEIKKIIQSSKLKESIEKNKKIINNSEYLDIFSLFQTLSFSQLKRLYSYLPITSRNKVVTNFFIDYKPSNKYFKLIENSFYVLINAFSKLRNILMHNGCLIKFEYEIKDEKIKENLEKYFNLSFSSSIMKLNEIILIMESIINIKEKIFDEIKESIKNKFKNKSKRNDKVSKIIFEIIENESRIKIIFDDIY